jgi:ketosteroid isomerase-like protein
MTELTASTVDRIARRRQAAVDTNDADALREIYAEDVVIWHNVDQIEQSLDDSLKTMGWFAKRMPDKHYDNLRRQTTPHGYIEQYVLRGTAPDGTKIEIPACLIVTVHGERITRLEEYLDSSHIAPLARRAAPERT